MNLALMLFGLSCFIFGFFRAALSEDETKKSGPRHGDKRIVKSYDAYWIENYIEFPGWTKSESYPTLDQAKQRKALWDQVREDPTIIEEEPK